MADAPSRKRKRVRIITDPAKYRRHQWQKVAGVLKTVAIYVVIACVAGVMLWLMLSKVSRHEGE